MAITAWAVPGTYSPQLLRQTIQGAMLVHTDSPISVMPGVNAGFIAAASGSESVIVGPGTCVVSPVVGTRGSYLVASDANATVTLQPRDTVYSRVDALTVQVRDNAHDASGFTDARIVPIKGVASVSPAPPAIPDGSLMVARVTVPKTGGAALAVDQSGVQWTSAIGGSMVGTQAQRLALPTTHLRPGQEFTQLDVKGKWRWDTVWAPTYPQNSIYLLGETQRDVNYDYKMVVTAGKLFAFPIRKPTGSPWNEQNTLTATTTSGFNWVAPYNGSYQIKAKTSVPSGENARYTMSIWKNLNATTIDQGVIGGPKPGATLLRETWQWIGGSSDSQPRPQPINVDISLIRLNAGDTISVTVWHNATSSKDVFWENPHEANLEITRWGD